NRTEMYIRSGNLAKASAECRRAHDIYRRLSSDPGIAEVHKFYGVLHRERGEGDEAERHFTEAVGLARRCGDRLLEAETLSEWARLHRTESRNRESLHALNDAYRIFAELHAARELLDLDRRLDGLEVDYLQVVRAWGES